MKTFEQDLQDAIAYHGHLCSGQIIGVRMARLALEALKIENPKDLIVYVESDRCITDAISSVTGCKLGKRSLKWMDYGKSAATFLNYKTGDALRVYRKERQHPPDGADLVEFFSTVRDDEMFSVTRVIVNFRPVDLPGKPLDSMTCPICGEEVIDGRQVKKDGVYICKACRDGSYYENAEV